MSTTFALSSCSTEAYPGARNEAACTLEFDDPPTGFPRGERHQLPSK